MAARSQRRYYEGRRANRDNNGIRNNIYVYGNTARELDVREAIREKPKKKPSIAVRKNQEKAMRMNPRSIRSSGHLVEFKASQL